jgi:hypothetical protein
MVRIPILMTTRQCVCMQLWKERVGITCTQGPSLAWARSHIGTKKAHRRYTRFTFHSADLFGGNIRDDIHVLICLPCLALMGHSLSLSVRIP